MFKVNLGVVLVPFLKPAWSLRTSLQFRIKKIVFGDG